MLIRTDRIGDVILSLPLVDVIKYNFPDIQIDFLVNNRVSELIDDFPNINKVHSIENDTIKDIKQICIHNRYDASVAIHPSFAIALALYLARVKIRLGTGYRWYSFLFNLKHFQHRKTSLKHELEYNIDLLEELGCVKPEKIVSHLEVSPETTEIVKKKLNNLGISTEKRFIIIHTVTLGSAKVWSRQNFISLIKLITGDRDCDFNIILTGTKDDTYVLNDIMKNFNKIESVNRIQDLNLKELAGLIKMSKLFISNSTGPIHIAAAVGTYVIGFYSPETSESAVRWGPYTDKKRIFIPKEKTNDKDIMDSISPEEVFHFVRQYMKSY